MARLLSYIKTFHFWFKLYIIDFWLFVQYVNLQGLMVWCDRRYFLKWSTSISESTFKQCGCTDVVNIYTCNLAFVLKDNLSNTTKIILDFCLSWASPDCTSGSPAVNQWSLCSHLTPWLLPAFLHILIGEPPGSGLSLAPAGLAVRPAQWQADAEGTILHPNPRRIPAPSWSTWPKNVLFKRPGAH